MTIMDTEQKDANASAAVTIPLPDQYGGSLVVDAEDAHLFQGRRLNRNGAHRIRRGGDFVYHLITGWAYVDHINGDYDDNRKANLRPVTPKQNAGNRGASDTTVTGFKGVSLYRTGKHVAKVSDGRNGRLWSGAFNTAEDAAKARDEAVRRLKDPATERFNFPLPGERGLDGTVA